MNEHDALQAEIDKLHRKLADAERLNDIYLGDLLRRAADYQLARAQLAKTEMELGEARRACSAATDGPWVWSDDGDNDLETMSVNMVVSITAGNLRDLLAKDRSPVKEGT